MKQDITGCQKSAFFRYGTMTLLLVMATFMLLIVYNVRIGSRMPVRIVSEHNGTEYCSMPADLPIGKGDTVEVNVTTGNNGTLTVTVIDVNITGNEKICRIKPLGTVKEDFYIADGFINVGNKRLLDVVFKK